MNVSRRASVPPLADLDPGMRLRVCDELEQQGVAGPGVSARLLPELYDAYEEGYRIEPASDGEVITALARIAGVCPASLVIAEALGFRILSVEQPDFTMSNPAAVQQALF